MPRPNSTNAAAEVLRPRPSSEKSNVLSRSSSLASNRPPREAGAHVEMPMLAQVDHAVDARVPEFEVETGTVRSEASSPRTLPSCFSRTHTRIKSQSQDDVPYCTITTQHAITQTETTYQKPIRTVDESIE